MAGSGSPPRHRFIYMIFYSFINQIIVEGKLGPPPDSDIAVDDIRVDKGPCAKGIQGIKNAVFFLIFEIFAWFYICQQEKKVRSLRLESAVTCIMYVEFETGLTSISPLKDFNFVIFSPILTFF